MVYFISDAHLGSRAFEHKRTQERKLVRFLDKIKDKADAVYLLGDMFDFSAVQEFCQCNGHYSTML